MRKHFGYSFAAVAACVVFAAAAASADSSMMTMGSHSAMKTTIVTPATIKWMAGTGEMKGLMVAVLDGDPNKMGPWTIRIQVKAGTKFPVHYHNDTERVTIISGTFAAALGSTYDASKLMDLPAGSYVVIPSGVRHYAAARTDCVVQLSGTQPFAMVTDKHM